MPLGFYSLDTRIQLARRAQHSLDVQYHLIQNDRTERRLTRNLRDAASRGVRVRLLVDDLYTAGPTRCFADWRNSRTWKWDCSIPFCCARQAIASIYLASITDFRSINHRRRNKLVENVGELSNDGTDDKYVHVYEIGRRDARADEFHGSGYDIEETRQSFRLRISFRERTGTRIPRLEEAERQGRHPHQSAGSDRRAAGSRGIRALPRRIAPNRRRSLRTQSYANPVKQAARASRFVPASLHAKTAVIDRTPSSESSPSVQTLRRKSSAPSMSAS